MRYFSFVPAFLFCFLFSATLLSQNKDSLTIVNLKAQIKGLQNDTTGYYDLKKKKEKLSDQFSDLFEKERQATNELNEYKERNSKLEQKAKNYDDMKKKVAGLEADLKKKEEAISQLRTSIKADSVKIVKLQQSDSKKTSELGSKEKQIANQKKEIDSLKTESRENKNELDQFKKDLDSCNSENEAIKNKNSDINKFIANYVQKELAEIDKLLKEQDPLAPDVKTKISATKTKISELKKISSEPDLVSKESTLNEFEASVDNLVAAKSAFDTHYEKKSISIYITTLKEIDTKKFDNIKLISANNQMVLQLEKYCACYNDIYEFFKIWETTSGYTPEYVRKDIEIDVRSRKVMDMPLMQYPFIRQEVDKRYANPGEKKNPFNKVSCE